MNLRVARVIVNTLQMGAIPLDCRERLSEIRPGQWEDTLSWLRRSGLALYWWSRIKAGKWGMAVPETIRKHLNDDLQDNLVRLSAMAKEFQILLTLIEGAEIPYALLKGFALTPEYCPEAALRSQYDFDFLVDAGSVSRIDEVFRQTGFIQKPRRSTCGPMVYFHSQRRPVMPKNLDRIFSPELHRTVEIHTSLWESDADRIRFTLPEDSLSRAVLKMWNGIAFLSLAPEEALVLQVLHILRHILNNQCRLSHLFELAVFLSEPGGRNRIWPAFQSVIQEDDRLTEATGIVFSLAASLFQVTVPSEVRAFTIDRLTSASTFWVRRYGIHSALSNFTASKSSLYLHSLFVDSESDWREIRRQRLFPVKRPSSVAPASDGGTASRLTAHSAQFAHVLRRSWFHGASALKYAWGLPEWRLHCKPEVRGMSSKRTVGSTQSPKSTSGE